MIKAIKPFLAITCLTLSSFAFADQTITMNLTADSGVGAPVGAVQITETTYGLLFTPNLENLTPGIHGFHIHDKASCDKNGMDAGGHFDPKNTGKHLGPYNDNGHYGDLPALYVDANGKVTTPVLAPRIKHISDINTHALMVHFAGDNYSDVPAPLGGGGKRMACGIIS